MLLDPRNVLGALGTGSFYSTLRQFTTASYYYDRALALRPQSVDAQLGKALAYLSQSGDLPGAQHLLPDFSGEAPNGVGLNIMGLFEVATLLDAGRQDRFEARVVGRGQEAEVQAERLQRVDDRVVDVARHQD